MGFGSFAATTQWYLYGRRYFTATGYVRASAKYVGPAIDTLDLSGLVYLVTGANSGIGRALSEFLASRGATLYMVCRNEQRGAMAQQEIIAMSGNDKVHKLIADVSLASGVRAAIAQLAERESQLDGLVCNAGAITSERTITAEGLEVTLAAGLVNGVYLLSKLAMPLLQRSRDPRVVFVSSGGMYNGRWPGWRVANAEEGKYNQELAYVYAKRGQVILAEELGKRHPEVKFVSCHPGWTLTPGVDGWLGSGVVALRPLRTIWQGTEGIAWLCAFDGAELKSGEFYLDRSPQPKHLAGPFFSEGSYTKNSEEEVLELMQKLQEVTAGGGDAAHQLVHNRR